MRIRFVDNLGSYEPKKEFGRELVFFKWGFLVCDTDSNIKEIEIFNSKKGILEIGEGYIQKWKSWRIEAKKIKPSYSIKTIPKKVWESKPI